MLAAGARVSAKYGKGYIVREHPRARSVKLRVDADGVVVVTVPPRFDRRRLDEIVGQHTGWIDAQRRKLSEWSKAAETSAEHRLPERIHLLAIDQSLSVRWIPANTPDRASYREKAGIVTVSGDLRSAEFCKAVLRRWVMRKASRELPPLLSEVSRETGLAFGDCTVRMPRTRWGSCTHRHNISLSGKLLFLPRSLVRSVMIHELCHTKHLNHSDEFWDLVRRFDPEYLRHRRELHAVGRSLPLWLEPGPDYRAFPDEAHSEPAQEGGSPEPVRDGESSAAPGPQMRLF